MSINHRLRQLRLERGMTQEQVAAKLGVTRQAISSYESGRTRPDIDTLVRLCDMYGTNLNSIVTGEGRLLRTKMGVEKTAIAILILLLCLTLLSALLLWSANRFFSISEGQLTQAEQELFTVHRRLTGGWEIVDEASLTVALLGFTALLIGMLHGRCAISIKKKVIYLTTLATGMLLIKLPFALTDPVFSLIDYYITPVSIIARMLFFFILNLILGVIQKKREHIV